MSGAGKAELAELRALPGVGLAVGKLKVFLARVLIEKIRGPLAAKKAARGEGEQEGCERVGGLCGLSAADADGAKPLGALVAKQIAAL